MEQQKNYVIAEETHEKIELALAQGRNWIAYNSNCYFLDNENLDVFSNKSHAISFAALCNEQNEEYHILHASSMADVYRQLPYNRDLNQILSLQNNTIMNTENLDYLKENLKYMGFGDKLNKELEQHIRDAKPEFQLQANTSFSGQQMEALLSFRRGEENEMYFFNKYSATLVKDGEPDLARSQTFYVNRGHGITFKEAFNLLEGRAVNKDLTDKQGQKYNAWVQLDFSAKDKYGNHEMKQYHANYGYDLDKSLSKHPIIELENVDDRKMLISSLRKGNLEPVSFEKDGVRERMFIEANPKYKSINIYDQDKKMLKEQSLKEEKVKEKSNNREEKKETKQEATQERGRRRSKDELEPESTAQKRNRR